MGARKQETAPSEVEKVNDVIWEFDASRDYDPSAGLGLIQARLLAVNFADDELNPVELGGLELASAQVKCGHAVTLPFGPKSRATSARPGSEVNSIRL